MLSSPPAWRRRLASRRSSSRSYRAPALRPQATGRLALDILVPDVGGLPWEAIAEYREHPGSEDARGKLREFEERAAAADPGDPLTFQREVPGSISEDLFAAIEDLRGSLTQDLADEAVKTGIGLDPGHWTRAWPGCVAVTGGDR